VEKKSMELKEFEDGKEFMNYFLPTNNSWDSSHPNMLRRRWGFRGQRDASWDLTPSGDLSPAMFGAEVSLVSVNRHGNVLVHQLATGKIICRIRCRAIAAAFTPDGELVVALEDSGDLSAPRLRRDS
jgi:hypothetical protein